jgi:two-component system LytT family sensor kinase
MLLKRRALIWLLLFGVASLLGYLDALGSYAASYSFDASERYFLPWRTALSWDLIKWNLWVLLAPFVLWLGQRIRFDRRNWTRVVPAYILIGVSAALLNSALLIFIHFFLTGSRVGLYGFLSYRYFVLIADALIGIVIYGLILVSAHALAYYREARENELRAAQLETQLAQAQLQALKMQVHPHFLFNALHSISAHLRDPETARRMIARLGDFLRLTLQNIGTQEVTLKQELEFLRCYLDIERTRFRDHLTVEMEIAPETWDARVPNLILQPLVENAIKHGLAPHAAHGRINVRARRLNGNLQVQIQDNGRGLQEAPITKAFGESASNNESEGIGLRTTLARLERLYPKAYRLQLRNAPEGGLIVTLEVPFKTTGADELSAGERSL